MNCTYRTAYVLPSIEVGGAEVFVTQLAQSQLDQGADVWIICVKRLGQLYERLSPQLQERVLLVPHRWNYDPRIISNLVKLFRSLKPDVVHTHMFTSILWAGPAARIARIPVRVHSLHAATPTVAPPLLAVHRHLSRRVDHLICCSPATLQMAQRYRFDAGHTSVIKNGIPLHTIERSSLDHQPLCVGTVGRLDPIKGQKYLIEAVKQLLDEGERLSLLLVGGGPIRAELEAQVHRLGIGEQVHFTGRVADVPSWLKKMDLFVLPSLTEALPIALLEAGAAGLPMIVTSSGGASVVLEQGAGGWSLTPRSPEAIVAHIKTYLALSLDERRQLGDQSHRTITEHYGIDGAREKTEALHRELLKAKGLQP